MLAAVPSTAQMDRYPIVISSSNVHDPEQWMLASVDLALQKPNVPYEAGRDQDLRMERQIMEMFAPKLKRVTQALGLMLSHRGKDHRLRH